MRGGEQSAVTPCALFGVALLQAPRRAQPGRWGCSGWRRAARRRSPELDLVAGADKKRLSVIGVLGIRAGRAKRPPVSMVTAWIPDQKPESSASSSSLSLSSCFQKLRGLEIAENGEVARPSRARTRMELWLEHWSWSGLRKAAGRAKRPLPSRALSPAPMKIANATFQTAPARGRKPPPPSERAFAGDQTRVGYNAPKHGWIAVHAMRWEKYRVEWDLWEIHDRQVDRGGQLWIYRCWQPHGPWRDVGAAPKRSSLRAGGTITAKRPNTA